MKGRAVAALCALALCTPAAGVTVGECGERRAARRVCVDQAWQSATQGATVQGSQRLNEAALGCLQQSGCVRRGRDGKAGNGGRSPRAADDQTPAAAAAPSKKGGGKKRELLRCVKRELGYNPNKKIAECMDGKGYGKEKKAQDGKSGKANGAKEKKTTRAQWKGFPKVYRKWAKCAASEQARQCIADATGLHVPKVKEGMCAAKALCQSVPDECVALLAERRAAQRKAKCECAQSMGVSADRLTELIAGCSKAAGGGQDAGAKKHRLVQLLERDCAAIEPKVKNAGRPKRDFCDDGGQTAGPTE